MKTSKLDIHPLDRYVKFLGNKVFVIIFATVMALTGVGLSILYSDWCWFSRFGSLITVAGLLLISSPAFVKGIYISNASTAVLAETDEEGNPVATTKEDRKVGNRILTGIVITILGTIVWGFGDLIGNVSSC